MRMDDANGYVSISAPVGDHPQTNGSQAWREAESHLRTVEPAFAEVIDTAGPCRLQPDPNLFVGIVDAIIGQQVSGKAATAIFNRFSALFSDGIAPGAVAAADPVALRGAGLSGAKVKYVLDLSQRVHDGRLNLDDLHEFEDEDIIARLTQVKGIGRWTSEMILIFHLNRPDVLPVDDLGIREGFKRLFSLPDRPSASEMLRMAEPWRPWRSAASWYLWRVIETR
jgi:DNA-3-methyladenine glycosylase II